MKLGILTNGSFTAFFEEGGTSTIVYIEEPFEANIMDDIVIGSLEEDVITCDVFHDENITGIVTEDSMGTDITEDDIDGNVGCP